MTESELSALLDAHDALVRACVEERLSLAEFLAAYDDFPRAYALDGSAATALEGAVFRLFRTRIAFHFRVLDVLSGLRSDEEYANTSDGGPGRVVTHVGLL
jgi:hypothetical protein